MRLLRAVSEAEASLSEDLNQDNKSSCFNAPTDAICTTNDANLHHNAKDCFFNDSNVLVRPVAQLLPLKMQHMNRDLRTSRANEHCQLVLEYRVQFLFALADNFRGGGTWKMGDSKNGKLNATYMCFTDSSCRGFQ